jgi:hypothetical protein
MSKTTNITTTIPFDEEKLTTLNVYLSQQNLSLDTMLIDVLNEALDKAFTKQVPVAVQTFLSLKNGLATQKTDEPKPIKKDKKGKTIDEQPFSVSEQIQKVG